jgi:hypothetical protein
MRNKMDFLSQMKSIYENILGYGTMLKAVPLKTGKR